MRNSLRLFGLLAVLGAVNVYVFFFNRGTAPREVLKPSSMIKAAEGQSETVKQATAEATAALSGRAPVTAGTVFGTPPGTLRSTANGSGYKKSKLPVPTGPSPIAGTAGNGGQDVSKTNPKANLTSGGGPPKGQPGGSPGEDDEGALSPEKRIGESDTLGQVLAREGFADEGPRIVSALSRMLDPRLIRGGQTYSVRLDEQGEPESFEYRPNAVTRFVVARGSSGAWITSRVDHALETKVLSASGTIDATLYESVQGAGEGSALAGLLVDLLAWDVNFYTDTHPGDYWKVVVEKQFLDGQFYRYGHILGAEYGGRVGTFRAFYWRPNGPSGQGRYFDERGQAISKTMLKTPLRYVRVSSKFDRHRFHPILHVERAHLGIDYAAPVGTPVWASSGGKVTECEMKRGSGNTVVLAHGNGITTRYYHLSRFARGLKAGKLVKQKDVIGFVGTTGLSTGPHLHFSVTKNGAFVDPSKVQVNRDPPVAERGAYLAAIKPRLATLRELAPGALARN